MTYREALARANSAYARLFRAPHRSPIDEQIIITELQADLRVATPDPPMPAPPIPQPPLPPCNTGEDIAEERAA